MGKVLTFLVFLALVSITGAALDGPLTLGAVAGCGPGVAGSRAGFAPRMTRVTGPNPEQPA